MQPGLTASTLVMPGLTVRMGRLRWSFSFGGLGMRLESCPSKFPGEAGAAGPDPEEQNPRLGAVKQWLLSLDVHQNHGGRGDAALIILTLRLLSDQLNVDVRWDLGLRIFNALLGIPTCTQG